MKTITFTCETITPMFLSGADGQTPELRPPSIKGALRFWWRAMNGELAPNEIYLNLKDTEQNIFGGTGGFKIGNDKTDALRSKFNIRISNVFDKETSTKNDFKGKGGLEYFFYLITSENKQGEMMAESDLALKDTVFDVIISAYETEDLLQACASFWLLTYFGGLGSRARRGAGSFEITCVEDEENILEGKLKMMPDSSSRSFLTEGLKQVSTILKAKSEGNISTKFSTIQFNHIYVAKNSKGDWKEALDEVAGYMKLVRTDKKMPPNRTQTQATLHQKAAFGLPISVRGEDDNVEFDKKDDFNHHSSPLYISVVKLNGKYYWTLVHLQGEFMPPNTKIKFKSKAYNKTFDWQDVDNQLVDKFINDKIKPNSIQISHE